MQDRAGGIVRVEVSMSHAARLFPVALAIAALSACGWMAGVSGPGATSDDGSDAPAGPTCRPKELDARGDAPWKVGDTTPGGWSVTAVDAEHAEFVRITLTKEGVETQIELAYNDQGPSDWATERYRLMPAPEATPPQELLDEAMAHLRAFTAAESGAPFVKRSEGVQDPYEGLPPCP